MPLLLPWANQPELASQQSLLFFAACCPPLEGSVVWWCCIIIHRSSSSRGYLDACTSAQDIVVGERGRGEIIRDVLWIVLVPYLVLQRGAALAEISRKNHKTGAAW